MRYRLRVFFGVMGLAVLLVVIVWGWSVGASLLTESSDAAVATAFLLLATVVALVVAAWTLPPKSRGPILALILTVTLSGCTRVDPGWEGIKVDMLGGDRGAAYPIVTGRVWYNPYSEDIYSFPTFLQRVVWTAQDGEGDAENDESFTFRSREGYAFNVDVGMGVSFKPGRTPQVFIKYRREPEAIINGPFRDVVREAFVQAGSQMEGLVILGSGMTQLNTTVTDLVRKQLGELVTVEYVNVVGKPRVDAQVEGAINAVIQATQQANEAQERVRLKEAEARQQVAQANGNAEALLINAKAKADAIRIEAEALRQFGAQVLEMRAIEKWNGTMPLVTGGGSMPFISLPSK